MRHGRAKAARKTLQFFRLSVGIVAPYQVILDGTFLVAMLSQKVPLRDRLDRTLQHQAYTLLVTRTSLRELETLSKQTAASNTEKAELFAQARQWGLDYADSIIEDESENSNQDGGDNDDSALGAPGKEILHLVRTKPEYFVCSQDEALLDVLRMTGTTPVMRLSRGVLLLENPSKAQQSRAKSKEKSKWTGAASVKEQEKKLVDHVRQNVRRERQEQQRSSTPHQEQRHSKKAKGPNPLSCKKKRPAGDSEGQKRKRRRKKGDGQAS
jgi:U3 small nucleolar RNA-associated protein 23